LIDQLYSMKFERHLKSLIDFANRNQGRNHFTVVSGVIKGDGLISMAINNGIRAHAEPQALRKYSRAGKGCKKGRSYCHQG
jgi:hypothetical protein